MRENDRQHAGPPRVPAARHGRGPAPADGDLRNRARRRRFRDRRGAGAGSAAQHARVPHAGRGRSGRCSRGHHLPDQRPGAGVAPGRLPVEEHSGRRVAGRCYARRAARSGRAGAADASDARRQACGALDERLPRAVAADAQPGDHPAGPAAVPRLRQHPARRVDQGNRAVLREPGTRGPQRARPVARGLHVPERPPCRALRGRGCVRQPFPARSGDRSGAAGAAGPRERADGDLLRGPDLGGAQGQVGARDAARRTAAAAAGQRAAAAGKRRTERAGVAAGADGAAPLESGVRELPRHHGSVGLRAGELRRDREMARGG